MITHSCNFDPLTPFYIVKLGCTGVNIIFLFLLQNIDCGYSLDPPHNMYQQSMFLSRNKRNNINFSFENYHFYSR